MYRQNGAGCLCSVVQEGEGAAELVKHSAGWRGKAYLTRTGHAFSACITRTFCQLTGSGDVAFEDSLEIFNSHWLSAVPAGLLRLLLLLPSTHGTSPVHCCTRQPYTAVLRHLVQHVHAPDCNFCITSHLISG